MQSLTESSLKMLDCYSSHGRSAAETLVWWWSTTSCQMERTTKTTASYFRGPFDLFTDLYCDSCYGQHCTHHTVDYSDGTYNTYSPVARDLWQRKPTLSSGCAIGLGWFTAINPRHLGYNCIGLWIQWCPPTVYKLGYSLLYTHSLHVHVSLCMRTLWDSDL